MHPFIGRSKALILAGLWLLGMAAPVESQTPVASRPSRMSASLPQGNPGFSRFNTIPSRRTVSPFGSGSMAAATGSRVTAPRLVRQNVMSPAPSPQPTPAPIFTQNSGTNFLVFPGTNPFFFSGTFLPPETLRFMALEQAALNATLNPGGALFPPGLTSLFPPGLNSLMPLGLSSLLPPGVNLFPFSSIPNTVFPTVPRSNLVPFVGVIPLLTGGLTIPGALPFVVGLSGEVDFGPNGEGEPNKNMSLLKSDIHLTPSQSTGNAGLLKIGPWPELLQRSAFQRERDQIEALVPDLTRQARARSVQAADLENLAQTVNDMRERLAGLIREVPDPQYIRAKRYLANLENVVKVLGQPDAGNRFNPRIEISKAKSVSSR